MDAHHKKMNNNDYLRIRIIRNQEKIKLFELNDNEHNKIVVNHLKNENEKLLKLFIKNGVKFQEII